MNQYHTYIMTNEPYGTLYIGVTSDLVKRVYDHKERLCKGFTDKYDLHRLVYFEDHSTIEEAIQGEKNLKHWLRDWKIDLINNTNSNWDDLALEWPEFSDDKMDSRLKAENDE